MRLRHWKILFLLFSFSHCAAYQLTPDNLRALKSPEELGIASQKSYQEAKLAPEKSEKLTRAWAGISYAEKCLKFDGKNSRCLYYNVLNRGLYIQNHIPQYQKSLQLMVKYCHALIESEPGYENAGCHRVLGSIYQQAPAFTLSSGGITRDLDKAREHFQAAAELAPDYAPNLLYYARLLSELGEVAEAKRQLAYFDQKRSASLDKEFPEWEKDRSKLAKRLNVK